MKKYIALAILLSLSLLIGCEQTPPPKPPPINQGIKMAITFDDLPAAKRETIEKIVAALKQYQVPTPYGFINGGYLFSQGVDYDSALDILRYWHQQGFPLGNHGFQHTAIKRFPSLAAAQENAERNEQILATVYQQDGKRDPLMYRYTYLDEGFNSQIGEAFRQYLNQRGYQIAHVSINVADWVWAQKYSECQQQGNQVALAQLKSAFIPYVLEVLQSRREASQQLFQRDIQHILLLHNNDFMGAVLSELLQALEASGVTFIGLEEAMRDPLYQKSQQQLLPKQSDILNKQAMLARQYNFTTPTQPAYPEGFAQLCK